MVDAEMDGSLRDEKGRSILIYMRQTQERADFVNFFRKFAKQSKEKKQSNIEKIRGKDDE